MNKKLFLIIAIFILQYSFLHGEELIVDTARLKYKYDNSAFVDDNTGDVLFFKRNLLDGLGIELMPYLTPIHRKTFFAKKSRDNLFNRLDFLTGGNDYNILPFCYIRFNKKTHKAQPLIKFTEVRRGELAGLKQKIWQFNIWNQLDSEIQQQTEISIALCEPLTKYMGPILETDYLRLVKDGKIVEFNSTRVKKIIQLYKKYSEKPVEYGFSSQRVSTASIATLEKLFNQSLSVTPEADYLPVLSINCNDFKEREDRKDWEIKCFINKRNGDFYQYISFDQLKMYPYPLNARMLALDYLAGVNNCFQSTVAIMLEKDKKLLIFTTNGTFSSKNILENIDKNRPWQPIDALVNKNLVPVARCPYINNLNFIYGSWCPIWELGIWKRLGIQLKRNPEAEVYLVGYGTLLQAAETNTVEEEHALIKKCGVQITPAMYQMFDRMGKQSKD